MLQSIQDEIIKNLRVLYGSRGLVYSVEAYSQQKN